MRLASHCGCEAWCLGQSEIDIEAWIEIEAWYLGQSEIGIEAWCLGQSEIGIWQRTERAMVRSMCSVKLVDKKLTKDLMQTLDLKEIKDQ